MADVIHRIGIKAPISKVYEAITSIQGLAGWWTKDVAGDGKLGGKIEFTFKTVTGEIKGRMVMQVEKLEANKSVAWKCVEGPSDWIGTQISFDLSTQDNQTLIIFGHKSWREATDMMAHCSMKWATFLLSLRDFVEHGKGKPSPDDLKIDNWN